jgi:hypothetical protein
MNVYYSQVDWRTLNETKRVYVNVGSLHSRDVQGTAYLKTPSQPRKKAKCHRDEVSSQWTITASAAHSTNPTECQSTKIRTSKAKRELKSRTADDLALSRSLISVRSPNGSFPVYTSTYSTKISRAKRQGQALWRREIDVLTKQKSTISKRGAEK